MKFKKYFKSEGKVSLGTLAHPDTVERTWRVRERTEFDSCLCGFSGIGSWQCILSLGQDFCLCKMGPDMYITRRGDRSGSQPPRERPGMPSLPLPWHRQDPPAADPCR